MSVWAIVPAAGSGQRFGGSLPKQYQRIGARCVLQHSVEALISARCFEQICVATAPGDTWFAPLTFSRQPQQCLGGGTRAESVYRALQSLAEIGAQDDDWVMVHDAARPGVSVALIARVLAAAAQYGGAIAALPASDTVQMAASPATASSAAHGSHAGSAASMPMLESTVARERVWLAQTPQCFRFGALRDALAVADWTSVTDEASVMRPHTPIALVEGERQNQKLTVAQEWPYIAQMVQGNTTDQVTSQQAGHAAMRVGIGYDVHRFGDGDFVTLGGVKIAFHRGLVAHSDGDVVLHALCDALLGAIALGDIGKHFPDTDSRWHNADSRDLLREVMRLLRREGWQLGNADLMVIAQAPRLAPYVLPMREYIASDCAVAVDAVSVKATTNEKIGFVGREEGIAAQAAVTLLRISS